MVKTPSLCASSSVPWIVLIYRRVWSSSQASLTASRAKRVVSLSALGRGNEESRLHTARVSPMIGGRKWKVGRTGWWKLEIKPRGPGRGGAVVPTARPFFPFTPTGARFGEGGGVRCGGVL